MINRQDERGELANGCYVVEFAPAHPDGSMPAEADWTRVGRMTLQTALTTNIDRGTNLEIRDICNALLQSQGEEPTISYDMGFVDIPYAALEFFADATVTGTGDSTLVAVHSYRATKNYAVRFYSPGRLGSWVATYPNTSVALDPATWTRENGYESAAHVTVLAVSQNDATHGMGRLISNSGFKIDSESKKQQFLIILAHSKYHAACPHGRIPDILVDFRQYRRMNLATSEAESCPSGACDDSKFLRYCGSAVRCAKDAVAESLLHRAGFGRLFQGQWPGQTRWAWHRAEGRWWIRS